MKKLLATSCQPLARIVVARTVPAKSQWLRGNS